MKRSQISWAIAAALGRTAGPVGTPRADLDRDLRRLVDVDRRLGLELAEKGQGLQFAFLDALPEGSGNEIDYGDYDAFALTIGVQLLDGGLPQAKVIGFMRSIRKALKHEHQRMLQGTPEEWLDHKPISTLKREIREGLLLKKPETMIWVVVETRQKEAMMASGSGLLYRRDRTPNDPGVANICRGGASLPAFMAQVSRSQGPAIVIELVNLAFKLDYFLKRAPIIKRGRPSGR